MHVTAWNWNEPKKKIFFAIKIISTGGDVDIKYLYSILLFCINVILWMAHKITMTYKDSFFPPSQTAQPPQFINVGWATSS